MTMENQFYEIVVHVFRFTPGAGAPIPEPGAALLFGVGFWVVGAKIRRAA